MSKQSAYFKLEEQPDKQTVKQIKQVMNKIPGVISVAVSKDHPQMSVDFDNTGTTSERIEKSVRGVGISLELESEQTHLM